MHERGEAVTEVKGSEPLLLITTSVGKENVLAEELENALFLEVPELRVKPLHRRGLVLVYGRKQGLEVARILDILRSKRVSRALWAIPIDLRCRAAYEDIKKSAVELIMFKLSGLPVLILCKCRKRGINIDSCSRLCRYLGEHLEALGIAVVDFRKYDYVLRIEIIDEDALLTIYERGKEKAFRISSVS